LPKFYQVDGALRRHIAMRYLVKDTPGRDLRVDFARGLALWMIFANHVPANALRPFLPQCFIMFDAADVFVALAGYAAGLVYGGSWTATGEAGRPVLRSDVPGWSMSPTS
jgi:hypothetical protein